MDKILCKNCQSLEDFTADLKCSQCNSKYYGHTLETLAPKYKALIESNFQVLRPPEYPSPPPMEPVQEEPIPKNEPSASSGGCGWLIVHTEGREPIDFPLVEGVNYIGRPVPDIQPHIQVPDDPFVSRGHAVLVVERLGTRLQYLLTDDQNNQRQDKSMNGTHVNGNHRRLEPGASEQLRDGDTVQIGETKLVLKTPEVASTLHDAKTQVKRMDYEKTIFKGN